VLFPDLGPLAVDEDGLLRSSPTTVPVLGQAACIVLEDYEGDPAPDDFHRAVAAFLVADSSTLNAAAPAVFAYYEDTRAAVSFALIWARRGITSRPMQAHQHCSECGQPVRCG
jgi:hypothetical protein